MTLGELIGQEKMLPAHLAETPITGITADSRGVQPGFLFAALPGVETDGARFIADALARGASAVLAPEGLHAVLAPEGLHAEDGAPVIEDPDPRRRLAFIAARFYGAQPETAVAVTGTNGKTSVASFVRQLWAAQGIAAASLGTIGVVSPAGHRVLRHTTPEPVELHAILSGLAADGVTHIALEASSHGLQQRRLDGVKLRAAAFTNISRDHLDYHKSFEDYFAQKLRLFRELLDPGTIAVVDMDSEAGAMVADEAKARGLEVISVGRAGETLKLLDDRIEGFAQILKLSYEGKNIDVRLPLVGGFQASNALVAAGLVLATSGRVEDVLPRLAGLEGARGRLDLAGTAPSGAPIFIDYAHTPDALAKALDALRPYAEGRLLTVFGCGGDRDRGKRPEMGAVATAKAELAIVTDDNPRREDPAQIRREIMAMAPGAIEIGDRAAAIAEAIAMLETGDVLLVAGKGHETGQTVGAAVIPFSDHDAVAAVLGKGKTLG